MMRRAWCRNGLFVRESYIRVCWTHRLAHLREFDTRLNVASGVFKIGVRGSGVLVDEVAEGVFVDLQNHTPDKPHSGTTWPRVCPTLCTGVSNSRKCAYMCVQHTRICLAVCPTHSNVCIYMCPTHSNVCIYVCPTH